MPYLDQPSLERSLGGAPSGRAVKVEGRREVWVPFLDGTLRSCFVIEWRQDKRGWWCLLRWGVWGKRLEEWYRHDEELMKPIGKAAGPFQDDATASSD